MSPKLKIREISPELQEHANKVLGEDPKRLPEDVRALREWLKKQPHIRADPDDQTLVTFLRASKSSVEQAKEKIDMYYTVRTAVPDLLQKRDWRLDVLKECLKIKPLVSLPGLDDKGRRVCILRGGVNDPNIVNQNDFNKAYLMMMDYIMREDDAALIKGLVLVVDMAAFSLSHIRHITPSIIKKMAVAATEGFPLQPEIYQLIHMPPMSQTFFNLARSFAGEQARSTAWILDNLEDLYKEVPKRILPTEYGGDAGPFDKIADAWNEKLVAYNKWFLSEEGKGVDEKKRQGKPKTPEDLLGIDGSFRKLEID